MYARIHEAGRPASGELLATQRAAQNYLRNGRAETKLVQPENRALENFFYGMASRMEVPGTKSIVHDWLGCKQVSRDTN